MFFDLYPCCFGCDLTICKDVGVALNVSFHHFIHNSSIHDQIKFLLNYRNSQLFLRMEWYNSRKRKEKKKQKSAYKQSFYQMLDKLKNNNVNWKESAIRYCQRLKIIIEHWVQVNWIQLKNLKPIYRWASTVPKFNLFAYYWKHETLCNCRCLNIFFYSSMVYVGGNGSQAQHRIFNGM